MTVKQHRDWIIELIDSLPTLQALHEEKDAATALDNSPERDILEARVAGAEVAEWLVSYALTSPAGAADPEEPDAVFEEIAQQMRHHFDAQPPE